MGSASLLLVDPAEQQELADAFDQPVPAVNLIVHQDRQDVVTVDQYPTPFHARGAFTALAASTGPGEEDATITPTGPLGAWYAVGPGGRFLGDARDLEQALGMLRAAMDADQVWPDIWFPTGWTPASHERPACGNEPGVAISQRRRDGLDAVR